MFYSAKSLSELESIITCQLSHVHKWLCANKLSLSIEKSSFVIFHPTQKKLDYNVQIFLNDLSIKREYTIKYLGITIDCNLNWKSHVAEISKKIKRNIGVICKLRNFVNSHILKNLYYSLIYPYLIYGIVAWGNTYTSSTNPLFLLQKKLIITTFSDYLDHTNSIFLALNILKFQDLVFYHNALFMYDFHSGNLPHIFSTFFSPVNQKHSYNTRLASRSTYSLPKVRTNFGKFNIRFIGPKIWNEVDETFKNCKKYKFKKMLKNSLIQFVTNP